MQVIGCKTNSSQDRNYFFIALLIIIPLSTIVITYFFTYERTALHYISESWYLNSYDHFLDLPRSVLL